jgi:hypothetical protein
LVYRDTLVGVPWLCGGRAAERKYFGDVSHTTYVGTKIVP